MCEAVKQICKLFPIGSLASLPDYDKWDFGGSIEDRLPAELVAKIESNDQLCRLLLGYWRSEGPGIVEVDLANVETAADLLSTVAKALDLDRDFGNSLDAFLEAAISSGVMPRKLVLRDWERVETAMPRDCELLQEYLRELGNECPECAIDLEFA